MSLSDHCACDLMQRSYKRQIIPHRKSRGRTAKQDTIETHVELRVEQTIMAIMERKQCQGGSSRHSCSAREIRCCVLTKDKWRENNVRNCTPRFKKKK